MKTDIKEKIKSIGVKAAEGKDKIKAKGEKAANFAEEKIKTTGEKAANFAEEKIKATGEKAASFAEEKSKSFSEKTKSKVYSRFDELPNAYVDGDIQEGCLVIEGGAFRGLYNQGVLDAMMLNNINIQTVVGVSAGALAGMNYVSGQVGRSARINIGYRHDSRYIGAKALKNGHSVIDLDFLLETCNDESQGINIEVYHEERMTDGRRTFVAVATDCISGLTRYFTVKNCSNIYAAIKASASMPYISPMVDVDGIPCLDGGCTCKIGYNYAIKKGYEKIVIIRTREPEFRKSAEKKSRMAKRVYRKYPIFAKKLARSDMKYNMQCDEIDELEKSGRAFVIAPSQPVTVSRLESDVEKLGELYWMGYNDMLAQLDDLKKYLGME